MMRRRLADQDRWVWVGAIGLVVAGLLVAAAIVTDGAPSRGINGIGALVWLASSVALLVGLRREPRYLVGVILATGVTVLLSFAVEPTSLATAVPGFALGGAAVAVATARPVAWALLVPGLWLPVHLLTAVLPAILRGGSGGDASVRTDPPPTSAIVPLLMIVSAGVAGWLVLQVRARRDGARGMASSPR